MVPLIFGTTAAYGLSMQFLRHETLDGRFWCILLEIRQRPPVRPVTASPPRWLCSRCTRFPHNQHALVTCTLAILRGARRVRTVDGPFRRLA